FTGAIATIPLGKNAYGLAVYLEALFLAIAIALRIRGLRAEAMDAQQKLNESLRRELEESRRAQRLSEERSWALQDLSEKGRLLLAAGHDSRQMISALRQYASGLRVGADDPALVEASRGIDEIASSLQDVLGSVVAGSGSGGIADRALAVDTLTASSLLGPLQLIHARDAARKGIELRVRASARPIVTDRVLVMRALGNLVSNAIRYTDSGRIVVALRPRGGDNVFQVWDTGPGLDPHDLALLLRGDAGAVRFDDRPGGSGSGLGLVQELAARLGGRLAARSAPGRGSVFELVLPHRSGLADPPPGARLVLLDRDRQKTALLEQAVRRAGWDFVRAESPDEATEVLRDAGPADLLLVDQHFGRVDGGLDLARHLGESQTARPLALLSYDRTAEARARLSAVASVLLYKPVTVRALEHGAALLRDCGRTAPPPPSRA
ncbi:MAG TPA: hybrid sensor histidine kinase/response regulator, partial [Alphaproteobacteria bacterium]|nr:hybrid sensor histidine kinase/response regulator [Alphaproteobacteria bacterium]